MTIPIDKNNQDYSDTKSPSQLKEAILRDFAENVFHVSYEELKNRHPKKLPNSKFKNDPEATQQLIRRRQELKNVSLGNATKGDHF